MPRLPLILLLLLLLTPLRAHQIAEMTVSVGAGDGTFRATVEADAAYMLPEFRGDEDEAPKDLAWLRTRNPEAWARIRSEAEDYLRECLAIRSDGSELVWTVGFPDFDEDPPTFMAEGIPELPPMIQVSIEGAFDGEVLSFRWDEPFGVVLIVQADSEVIPVISGYEEPVMRQSVGSPAQASPPSFGGWVRLGFRHILPDGLDHVLFVLGIFLLLPKWKPLLGQSLVFTLAHSLTLLLATLGWVALPAFWVELAIAASIAWIGIENLWVRTAGRGRYLLIAAFGLIHGLGFARMLAELLPKERTDALIMALVGFNAGVEIGQIVVLAAAFALCGWWSEKHFAHARIGGSVLVALAGLAMFVSRLAAG